MKLGLFVSFCDFPAYKNSLVSAYDPCIDHGVIIDHRV